MTLWILWRTHRPQSRCPQLGLSTGGRGHESPVDPAPASVARGAAAARSSRPMGTSAVVRQRWMGLEWIDRFGTCVVIGFVTTIVTLATLTACNEDPPPTLPRLPFPSIVNTE